MYRKINGKVHGVLADYDLASWRSTLTLDRAKISHQRTGTPPFMAHGLLDGSDPIHLYRHDLESLFYTMLILATHYEIQAPGEGDGGIRVLEGDLRFQDWFETTNYNRLGEGKSDFFTKLKAFEPSPSLAGFRGWLWGLQDMFHQGFVAQNAHWRLQRRKEQFGGKVTLPHFDEETLGGHITYSALIQMVRNLPGNFQGLAIRYDPPKVPPSTATIALRTLT